MTVYTWSQTAASNATADSTVNFRENQAPSTVNDSARAVMAAVAKYRDDLSGILNTAGASTAYTITSNQVLAALTDGFCISARVHATSGAAPTLSVDGLAAKVIRIHTSTAIPTGALLSGGLYTFTYDSGDDCWYVHDYFNVPLAAGSVTNAMLADAAAWTMKLRNAGTTGAVSDAALADLTAASSAAAADFLTGFLSTGEIRKFALSLLGILGVAQEWTAAQNFDAQALTDATTINWNLNTQQAAKVTLGGNRTLGNPTNMKDGGFYSLMITQDATGSRTLAYDTAYKWPGGTAPVLTTTAGAKDMLVLYSDGASMYGSLQKAFA